MLYSNLFLSCLIAACETIARFVIAGNHPESRNLAPRRDAARSNFHRPLALENMSRQASTIGPRVLERCILYREW
jgi:hypothetical protein